MPLRQRGVVDAIEAWLNANGFSEIHALKAGARGYDIAAKHSSDTGVSRHAGAGTVRAHSQPGVANASGGSARRVPGGVEPSRAFLHSLCPHKQRPNDL